MDKGRRRSPTVSGCLIRPGALGGRLVAFSPPGPSTRRNVPRFEATGAGCNRSRLEAPKGFHPRVGSSNRSSPGFGLVGYWATPAGARALRQDRIPTCPAIRRAGRDGTCPGPAFAGAPRQETDAGNRLREHSDTLGRPLLRVPQHRGILEAATHLLEHRAKTTERSQLRSGPGHSPRV